MVGFYVLSGGSSSMLLTISTIPCWYAVTYMVLKSSTLTLVCAMHGNLFKGRQQVH